MDEWKRYLAAQSRAYMEHVRRLVASRATWDAIIEQDMALIDGLRGIDYTREQVSGGQYADRTAELLDRLEANRRQHEASMAALVEAVEDAQRRVSRIDAPYSTLLLLRYVSDLPWQEVAGRLHYSEFHCRRELHDEALAHLYDHLPQEWKDPRPSAV